jgi:hypothetical protein
VVRLSGGAGSVHIDAIGQPLLSTEAPGIVDEPQPIRVGRGAVEFTRPGAIVLALR